MNEWTNEWMNEWTNMHELFDESAKEQMNEQWIEYGENAWLCSTVTRCGSNKACDSPSQNKAFARPPISGNCKDPILGRRVCLFFWGGVVERGFLLEDFTDRRWFCRRVIPKLCFCGFLPLAKAAGHPHLPSENKKTMVVIFCIFNVAIRKETPNPFFKSFFSKSKLVTCPPLNKLILRRLVRCKYFPENLSTRACLDWLCDKWMAGSCIDVLYIYSHIVYTFNASKFRELQDWCHAILSRICSSNGWWFE